MLARSLRRRTDSVISGLWLDMAVAALWIGELFLAVEPIEKTGGEIDGGTAEKRWFDPSIRLG
jgi:hypothetical protein